MTPRQAAEVLVTKCLFEGVWNKMQLHYTDLNWMEFSYTEWVHQGRRGCSEKMLNFYREMERLIENDRT